MNTEPDEAAAQKKKRALTLGVAVALLGSLTCCCCPFLGNVYYVNVVDNPPPPDAVNSRFEQHYDDMVDAAEAIAEVCQEHRDRSRVGPNPIGLSHPVRHTGGRLYLGCSFPNAENVSLDLGAGHPRPFGVRQARTESYNHSENFLGIEAGQENGEFVYWQMSLGRGLMRIVIHRPTVGCDHDNCFAEVVLDVPWP